MSSVRCAGNGTNGTEMTLPILFLLAIAVCIIVVILFVRSERRKDRAYASALPSRRQHDCANLHIDDDIAEMVAIANKAADERLEWQLSRLRDAPVNSRVDSSGIPINHPSDDPLSEYTPRYVEAPISNSCNCSDSSSHAYPVDSHTY